MAGGGENYTLRAGRPGDIPQLVLIELAGNTLFAPTGLIPAEHMDDHIAIDWHQDAIEAGMSFVAADRSDAPVGFALCSERAPDLYLDEIAVHPDHGRRGLGGALVTCVMDEARARRLPSVSLSTFRDVPWNGPFYARHGFKEIAAAKWTDWMHELNTVQAETLDVTRRCFMRRPARRHLFRQRG